MKEYTNSWSSWTGETVQVFKTVRKDHNMYDKIGEFYGMPETHKIGVGSFL